MNRQTFLGTSPSTLKGIFCSIIAAKNRQSPEIMAVRLRLAPFLVFMAAPLLLCSSARGVESLERRLLRTIQVGAPQDINVEQIRKIADNNDTDYTTEILARS